MATVDGKRRQRFEFMEAVYNATQGDRFRFTELGVIAPAIGVSELEADQIAQYLVDEGLLGWAAFGGVIEITHRGIKEVEQARSQPNEPTVHFPPFNLIHVEHMSHSQIQQGTEGSVQQMTQGVSSAESNALRHFLAALDDVQRELELTVDAQDEMEAQLATIEAQLRSARPKRSILKDACATVLEILNSAPGRAAVEAALKHLPDWIR